MEIKRIGICGSDIHFYCGKPLFTKYSVMQDHEIAGVIVQVGDSVVRTLRKNAIDGGRLRVHNERTLNGKLFVSFIALVLISRLRDDLSKVPGREIRYWNWREVLAYSSSYGKCSFSGKCKDVYTVPTKGQRQIFKALGIPYYWRECLVGEAEEETVSADETGAENSLG